MSEETPATEEKEKGRLYWFFKNLRTKIATGLKAWAKKHWVLASILVIVLLDMVITGRGSYQVVFLNIRKYFLLVVLLSLLAWLFFRWVDRAKVVWKIVLSLIFVGLLAASWFFGPGVYEYIGLYYHYQKLDKTELKELPLTDHERIQPLNSVRTLVMQNVLAETEEASSPTFILRKDGGYDFSMVVGPSPEYSWQLLTKDMYKVLSVNATTPAPDFSSKNQHEVKFDIGEHLLFSKKTKNAVTKRFNFLQFFSYEPAEIMFIENDAGEWVQVVSLIKWEGWLIPRPVFGGVMIIPQREASFGGWMERVFLGVGKWIKPDEITKTSFLKRQNLIPERVARFTAESFRFQEGFLAPMPGYHEGDIRIPHLPEDQNQQPFVAYFDFEGTGANEGQKLCNYFGLEPYQESKKGLNTSLFIPGDNDRKVYYIDHSANKEALTGSSAVPSRILESRKEYDWEKNYPAESRPYIKEIDGKRRFFWLSTVVTRTDPESGEFIGGSIPDVTLTDAHYGQVIWVNKPSIANTGDWNGQIAEEMQKFWEAN